MLQGFFEGHSLSAVEEITLQILRGASFQSSSCVFFAVCVGSHD